ncbi:MAG: hypothetical protein B6U89_07495 [Desulfurococcales archaeon ex4484_58]|nr:MAG: hypothetical protein B6U89_07495 [Desulfurococcales archaeon ex4484_58]
MVGVLRVYDKVEVIAPARLHLGFYNFRGLGTGYGGIGVAIEPPFIRVRVARSTTFNFINYSGIDVDDVVENVVDKLDVKYVEIKVYSAIPRHVGLGSTTQLSLAIGYGINKVFDLGYTIRELAALFGRGFISGIGIGVFEQGGFIVDSGRRLSGGKVVKPKKPDDLPLVLARYSFPNNWYFIVLVPETDYRVLEAEERKLLRKPLSIDLETQNKLYQLLLFKIIPSIMRKDLDGFSKALTKIQFLTGKYFSKYQGGIFCCRETEAVIKALLRHGVKGVGQSSWGPVAYGVIDNYYRGVRIMNSVVEELKEEGINVKYKYVSKPRNRGYSVRH